LRKIFDLRRTLLQPNAQSYGFLEAWSDVTADKFLPEYFPEHIPELRFVQSEPGC
jgi:hypothetical protein